MPGPFPVVGITAKFANALGRSPYEPDITVPLVDEDEELITLEQGAYLPGDAFRTVRITGIDGRKYRP
jgi:hypothetical protein